MRRGLSPLPIAGIAPGPYTPALPMSDETVIDPDALARLSDWGGERLREQMIQLFLQNSPERMAQLREGFEADDLRQVERAVHSLKSSAGNVGAVEVNRIAQRLEDLAHDGETEEARAVHADLVRAHDIASRALRDVLEGRST